MKEIKYFKTKAVLIISFVLIMLNVIFWILRSISKDNPAIDGVVVLVKIVIYMVVLSLTIKYAIKYKEQIQNDNKSGILNNDNTEQDNQDKKESKKNVFLKYLSRDVIKSITNPDTALTGTVTLAIVMVTKLDTNAYGIDINNVKEIHESMNKYIEIVSRATYANQGDLLSIAGGYCLSVFKDNSGDSKALSNSLKAAFEIDKQGVYQKKDTQDRIVIALASGEICLSRFGCKEREAFTAIGNPVEVSTMIAFDRLNVGIICDKNMCGKLITSNLFQSNQFKESKRDYGLCYKINIDDGR